MIDSTIEDLPHQLTCDKVIPISLISWLIITANSLGLESLSVIGCYSKEIRRCSISNIHVNCLFVYVVIGQVEVNLSIGRVETMHYFITAIGTNIKVASTRSRPGWWICESYKQSLG